MVRTRADEYEEAVRQLRAMRDEVTESSGVLARSAPPTIASGGTLRSAIDETLGVIVRQCLRASEEIDRVASVCAQRALVCREFEAGWASYARQYERWTQLDADQRGWPPSPPRPPANWVVP